MNSCKEIAERIVFQRMSFTEKFEGKPNSTPRINSEEQKQTKRKFQNENFTFVYRLLILLIKPQVDG